MSIVFTCSHFTSVVCDRQMVTGYECQNCLEPFGLSQAKFCVFCGYPRKFETPAELEQLTPEYEQQRNLNIQRNNAFMESLSLTSLTSMKIVNKQKGISRQKKDATNIIWPAMSSKWVSEISELSTAWIYKLFMNAFVSCSIWMYFMLVRSF